MKKIAVFNQKGGVGKTAVTVNLASCFADYFKRKVLVIDCDSQANCSTYLLADEEVTGYTLTHYIDGILKGEPIERQKIINSSCYIKRVKKNIRDKQSKYIFREFHVDVIPSDSNISFLDVADHKMLGNLLKDMESDYDYCLMDCPPHLSDLAINALSTADYVLVPATPTKDSLGGYSEILEAIDSLKNNGVNPNLEMLGVVFNRVDMKRSIDRAIIQMCHETVGREICKTMISESTLVEQANMLARPLNACAPRQKVSLEFKALAKELDTKIRIGRV